MGPPLEVLPVVDVRVNVIANQQVGKVEVFGPGDESNLGGPDEMIVIDVGVNVGVSGEPTLPAQVERLLQPDFGGARTAGQDGNLPGDRLVFETLHYLQGGFAGRQIHLELAAAVKVVVPAEGLSVVGIGHPGLGPRRPVVPPVGACKVDSGRRHRALLIQHTQLQAARLDHPTLQRNGPGTALGSHFQAGHGLRVRLGVQRHIGARHLAGQ